MKEHLISVLYTLQVYQDFLFVMYMCVGAIALKVIGREIVTSKILSCVAAGLGLLLIAIYLTTLVNYLLYTNYVDHVEATVASIAWLGMHGHALYPSWVTDDVYGLVYGPVFIFAAWIISANPSRNCHVKNIGRGVLPRFFRSDFYRHKT